MTAVEPIRNINDLKKVEDVLSKNERDLLFFTVGTNCGLRISDILSLNVGDVRGKSHIQLVEKKTGKFKKFPINAKLKPMFEDFTKGKKADEPLFKTIFQHRLERVAAYYIIRNACEKAGIEEKVGTHTIIIIKNLRMSRCFRKCSTIQVLKSH